MSIEQESQNLEVMNNFLYSKANNFNLFLFTPNLYINILLFCRHKLHCNDASFIADMKENINTNRSVSKEDDTEKPLLLVCVDRTEVIPKQELVNLI